MELFKSIGTLPEILPPDAKRDWKIAHPGRVARPIAEIVVRLLAGFATASVLVRIIIHLRNRGKLFLDDYVVIFATACLVIETALFYHNVQMIYIGTSLAQNPANITLFTRSQVLQIVQRFLKWTNIWQAFAWTTIYMIKISFLIFFRTLVRDVSRRLNMYLHYLLCVAIGAWIYSSFETMLIFGANNSVESFPFSVLKRVTGGASNGLDMFTDLAIFSIPILLLRKSRLRTRDKFRILTFLCLSIIMVVFATARVIGEFSRDSSGHRTYSLAWAILFLHIESSIAVMVGGATAFRTVFKRQSHDEEDARLPTMDGNPKWTLKQYLKHSFLGTRFDEGLTATETSKRSMRDKLGTLRMGPELTSLRTFIRRSGRTSRQITVRSTVEIEGEFSLEDYANHIRYEQGSSIAASNQIDLSENTDRVGQNSKPIECPLPTLRTH